MRELMNILPMLMLMLLLLMALLMLMLLLLMVLLMLMLLLLMVLLMLTLPLLMLLLMLLGLRWRWRWRCGERILRRGHIASRRLRLGPAASLLCARPRRLSIELEPSHHAVAAR